MHLAVRFRFKRTLVLWWGKSTDFKDYTDDHPGLILRKPTKANTPPAATDERSQAAMAQFEVMPSTLVEYKIDPMSLNEPPPPSYSPTGLDHRTQPNDTPSFKTLRQESGRLEECPHPNRHLNTDKTDCTRCGATWAPPELSSSGASRTQEGRSTGFHNS